MKIPFGKTFSVTSAQLRDGIAQGLIDGYQDHDGAYKSRLGLTEWATFPAGVDGIYSATNGKIVVAAGGRAYVSDIYGNHSVCTGATIGSGHAITFCEDSNYVYIGHGGRIAQVNTAALTITLLDSATAPMGVTHVAYIQGYLVANGTSGIAGDTFYTGPSTIAGYLTDWEVFNNESIPDGNLAVAADGQFIYSFGQQSVEIATNDGVTPWSKYSIGYIPYGIHAPYSLVRIDSTYYWLGEGDSALRIMRLTGGSPKTVSTPYDSVINALGVTTDAYAFTCGIDGHTFYVLQFPTEQLTFVYHIQSDAWYRWGHFDTGTAEYTNYKGTCQTYSSQLTSSLIGTASGTVATLAGLSDLGDIIRFELTSGNVRAETYKQKRAGRMRFQLQRGTTNSLTEVPFFMWSHRDDGGNWTPERQVSLGSIGQYGYIGQLDRCGIYRERQHKIVFTNTSCQFVFVECEEDTRLLKD